MIPVALATEPPRFEQTVRAPGLRALAEMVGKAPAQPRTKGRAFKQRKDRGGVLISREDALPSTEFPAYWTEVLDDLMDLYNEVCAYSCFRIHPVTGGRSVDHMAPKSLAWDRVYEWDNYCLCCSLMNANKGAFDDVLDPFEVEDGWFVLELVGYQVLPAKGLDEARASRVKATIDRLKLNSPRCRKTREEHVQDYIDGDVSFGVLLRESPFVAAELRRQGRLRNVDGPAY